MFDKGEIPFVRLLIPLILGILSGYYFDSEMLYNSSPAIAFVTLTTLFLFIIYYRRFSLFQIKWLAGSILNFLIAVAGYWLTIYMSEKHEKTYYTLRKADAFIVKIISEPKSSDDISRFEAVILQTSIKSRLNAARGKIIVSIKYDSIQSLGLKYGDVLLITGKFDSIDPPYNPGEFNYKAYLADRQFYYQTFIQGEQFCILDRDQGNKWVSFALALRQQLIQKLNRYLPDKDAAAFASTLILGYRAELSKELIEAYSKTGTMHVLSVSGMHVGIVFVVLSAVLKFMDRTRNARLIRAAIIILIIWFYALLTGFSAPASRAAIMLSFIVLGKALNKHQNTYNLVAVSAFFLLLYNPFYIVDAGFQLSYLAVVGLVYFHPKIYQMIYVKNKLLDVTWSYCALSIAAQVATFPFSIYYFHQFPIYFLVSNLAIVLPVAIIMYSGILFMFIPFPALLFYTGHFLSLLIKFTNEILFAIENFPFSSLDGIWISSTECFMICLLIIILSIRLQTNFLKYNLPIATLVILLCLSVSLTWIRNYNGHQVIFYNLRRSSAIGYVFKGRSVIVSDLDPYSKLINFSVLPVIKSKGSRKELFYTTESAFMGDSYTGNSHYYQFGFYRILRWSKSLDNIEFSKRLLVDAVLISDNPRVSIKKVANCLTFSRIIIDSNNPDYKINQWVFEANDMGLDYYVLKKNPSLIVKL